jgi:hypothetical protein
MQLGSVAARAIVDPVSVIAAAAVVAAIRPSIALVIPATIAATGLTIVDQWWVLSFKVIPNALLQSLCTAAPGRTVPSERPNPQQASSANLSAPP